MDYRLIGPMTVQLARTLFLIKGARPVKLVGGGRNWALLVEGRGFVRLLQDDMLPPGNLYASSRAGSPRPRTFFSCEHAVAEAERIGLKRRRRGWAIEGERKTVSK